MSDSKQPVIVIIEDEASIRRIYDVILSRAGMEVHSFANHKDADAWLDTHKADAIITDERIENQAETGVEWTKRLTAGATLNHNTPVIVSSGSAEEKDVLDAGAKLLIEKPFKPNQITDALSEVLGQEVSPPGRNR